MAKSAISATIEEDLIKWMDKEIRNSRKYRNKSHLIEIAIENLKEESKK